MINTFAHLVVRNNPDGSPVADILLMSMEEIDVTKQASNLKKVIHVFCCK